MQRDIFDDDHRSFRETVRAFVETDIAPHHEQWESDGIVPRHVWSAAGRLGLLGIEIPTEHGGSGIDDFRFNAIVAEELARGGASGVGIPVHNDMVGPYLLKWSTEEQKRRWLPGFCSGELIAAIAMTEPGAGSDLQGITTTAKRDGDSYVVNGQKTFITNGINADLAVVVAKTDPGAGHEGVSLLVAERGMDGFTRGRNLDKIGLKAQDTAEMFFDNVRVPATNLLGEEGKGFVYLMQGLPKERLTLALAGLVAAETVFEQTRQYCRQREAFGRSIGRFQHVRFTLAEMATELRIARVFVDKCISQLVAGEFGVVEAAMCKWWVTELQKKVVDQCVQLHGGFGYMSEYPVAKAYLDTRAQTIYGGTTEIMKEIVGRSLDL